MELETWNLKLLMSDEQDKRASEPQIASDAFEREVTTDLDEETPDRPKGMPLRPMSQGAKATSF